VLIPANVADGLKVNLTPLLMLGVTEKVVPVDSVLFKRDCDPVFDMSDTDVLPTLARNLLSSVKMLLSYQMSPLAGVDGSPLRTPTFKPAKVNDGEKVTFPVPVNVVLKPAWLNDVFSVSVPPNFTSLPTLVKPLLAVVKPPPLPS
jgi:hypothetical protein